MKIEVSNTDVTKEQFIEDIELFADAWVIDKMCAIYERIDELFENPMFVNVLHVWADGKREYDKQLDHIKEIIKRVFIEKEEVAVELYGTNWEYFEERQKTIRDIYWKSEYYRVIVDILVH